MGEEIKIRVSAQADTASAQADLDKLKKSAEDAKKAGSQAEKPAGSGRAAAAPATGGASAGPKAVDPKREVERLNKAAADYESKGMTTAAKSARQDADAKHLAAIEWRKQSANLLREQGNEAAAKETEKEVEQLQRAYDLRKKIGGTFADNMRLAREMMAAEAKANTDHGGGGIFNSRARQEMITAARLTAEGQSPTRSIGSVLGQVLPHIMEKMSTAAMAGLGSVAAAVGMGISYVNSYIGARRRDESIAFERQAEQNQDRRDFRILRSWRGTSNQAVDMSFAERERQQQLQDQLPQARQKRLRSIWNPLYYWDAYKERRNKDYEQTTIFGEKTEAQLALDQQKEEIARAGRRSSMAGAEARRKFDVGEGGLQLEMSEGTAMRSAAGMQKRKVAEGTLVWLQEYNRVMAQVNDDNIANRSAMLQVGEWQKNQQLRAASGLVNVRSGSGDIAQAATIASGQMADWRQLGDKIENLHNTVRFYNEQHQRQNPR